MKKTSCSARGVFYGHRQITEHKSKIVMGGTPE
ncbi:hypothetical protein ANO14919_056950 [Xylariales sp. No.14919]|nr:hypothetical protein ANO14919_056950 [Xylariales sp. No.14919]